MKKIKVDKVILYYMDRVDPDGNLYRFYVYKDMASEIEYIEVGKLPYSIGLNYLRNLQELSVEAVDYLSGLKECSREESFNIIQEWAKEFTEKYENYDFNGSYYDVIDAFIDEKLKTI